MLVCLKREPPWTCRRVVPAGKVRTGAQAVKGGESTGPPLVAAVRPRTAKRTDRVVRDRRSADRREWRGHGQGTAHQGTGLLVSGEDAPTAPTHLQPRRASSASCSDPQDQTCAGGRQLARHSVRSAARRDAAGEAERPYEAVRAAEQAGTMLYDPDEVRPTLGQLRAPGPGSRDQRSRGSPPPVVHRPISVLRIPERTIRLGRQRGAATSRRRYWATHSQASAGQCLTG